MTFAPAGKSLISSLQEEINFILDREKDAHIICDALEEKRIPLRVTHNDTKLNNIMIDDKTGKGLSKRLTVLWKFTMVSCKVSAG